MQEQVLQSGVAAKSLLEDATINGRALIKIALIIGACICLLLLLRVLKRRIIHFLKKRDAARGTNARDILLTLIPLGESVAKFLILTLGMASCLSALHISVSPFVYCLGFISAGLALGAQDTFTDIIRGVLTLAEGRISVGDRVSINGTKGNVIGMTIRQITIRHLDGSTEAFPFSKIGTIQNFSVGDTVMSCVFCLAPDSDANVFQALAQETVDLMRQENAWKRYFVQKTPQFLSFTFQTVTNKSVKVEVNLRIKNDPSGVFASEFTRRMWEKLRQTTMLHC